MENKVSLIKVIPLARPLRDNVPLCYTSIPLNSPSQVLYVLWLALQRF